MKVINVNELKGRKFYFYALSKDEAEKFKAPASHKFFIVQFKDGESERGVLYVKVKRDVN